MDRRNQRGTFMTRHFDFPRPHLQLPSLRRHHRRDFELSRGSLDLGAAGAIAIGALAFGVLAVGAIAIGALAVKRARIEHLSVGTLDVGRLVIREREDPDDEVFDEPEARAEAA
jgi:hypothetical protein